MTSFISYRASRIPYLQFQQIPLPRNEQRLEPAFVRSQGIERPARRDQTWFEAVLIGHGVTAAAQCFRGAWDGRAIRIRTTAIRARLLRENFAGAVARNAGNRAPRLPQILPRPE